MPISQEAHEELYKRWKGPPSPYREVIQRVSTEVGNHVIAQKYVTEQQLETRVNGRVKDITRITEKVDRTGLRHIGTIEELEDAITDISGVRVTVDFLQQMDEIKEWAIHHDAWTVVEVEDQIRENGYRAIHVDLKLNTTNFSDVYCELQIRTLLQDAWAIWSHPLYEEYRQDLSSIPEQKMKLMRQLSNLLNNVDELAQTLILEDN